MHSLRSQYTIGSKAVATVAFVLINMALVVFHLWVCWRDIKALLTRLRARLTSSTANNPEDKADCVIFAKENSPAETGLNQTVNFRDRTNLDM